MRILLLNPPFLGEYGRFSREQRSPAITKGGTFYYPFWLCYAAGVLEKDGFDIQIIDAPASRMGSEDLRAKVRDFQPQMIVVNTSTPSIINDVSIASDLKEMTGAFTVLVGTHPSALPSETLRLNSGIDAIARKEYEYTLQELARKLRDSDGLLDYFDLESIDGLSFHIGDEIIHNPDRSLIENLDEIPFVSKVYKKHLDIRDYFYTIAQYPQVAIFSGRGCPHGCVYCVYPQVMHGRKYRKRTIPNLIEEFKYIENELPEVREVFIEDDTFTVDQNRVFAFSHAYQDAGLKISWIANSRADIDIETLKALKACNCRLLCVGFESGDQNVLDAMNKHLKVEKAKQFVEDAKKAGILIHGCFMVGNPGETKETLETTLRYAKSLKLDTAQFFPIMVYPGTKAYSWAKENGYLLTEDFSKWNTETGLHNCVVSRPDLSNDELVEFCDRARREFYLRPSYILYRIERFIRYPGEDGLRMLKSINTFWKFLFHGTK
ncbi:radical SAM protein [Candidatus Poribacteria bacterium]|nr:radical SAM protein [Candidatus Poribacteria bacterium]